MSPLAALVDPRPALAAHAASRLPMRRVHGCLSPDADEESDRANPPGQRGYISYNLRLAAMRQYMRQRRARERQARAWAAPPDLAGVDSTAELAGRPGGNEALSVG